MSSPTVYYRLTNEYNGPRWALDVVPDSSGELSIAKAGDYSGQHWKLVPVNGQANKFYLRTLYKGDELSLDIINDGTNDRVHLAKTGNFTGQFWTLTKVSPEGTTFRLSTDFTGPNKFLDVFSDKMKPRMATGNATGMNWELTVTRIGS
ncbi:carbohydrate-binding module family 13 protein [Morchella snyderi]|nr:carbohydrate-binding module family 13 protein [Morchella snyderi]